MALNGASRDPTSSSLVTHFCLMAKESKVSPTLKPNMSSVGDDVDNDNVDTVEENDYIASLNIKGEMIAKALHKNKTARSNFMEILTIAIWARITLRSWKLISRRMRSPLIEWEAMSVITLLRLRNYLKLSKKNKLPRNLLRRLLL